MIDNKVFFIADTHFFHANVLRFDKRPWESLEAMHQAMLEKWNKKVSPADHVYILGDFSWRVHPEAIEFLKKLNGNLHLVRGNHDSLHHNPYKTIFVSVKDYEDIEVRCNDGRVQRCILSHYYHPFYNGHRYGAVMLHGHSHTTSEADMERKVTAQLNNEMGLNLQIFNVGCMYWGYEPVTIDEILSTKESTCQN